MSKTRVGTGETATPAPSVTATLPNIAPTFDPNAGNGTPLPTLASSPTPLNLLPTPTMNGPPAAANSWSLNWTYDATGNRLSQTADGVTTPYSYNVNDQLTAAGTTLYTYDLRGNLTRTTAGSAVTTYTWDAADRLIGAALPNGTTTANQYDADGRRVKTTENGVTTNYLWDELSAYGDVVLESDASGNALASYVLGGSELLRQNRAGVFSYYLADGQGSARKLTDSSGAVSDSYVYDAFGTRRSAPGATINKYLYTGQQYDSATDLYSLRAWYYSPGTGRFISRDTWAVDTGNPIELNRYGYTANDPINLSDPSGYFATANYGHGNFISGLAAAGLALLGRSLAYFTLQRVVIWLVLIGFGSAQLGALINGLGITSPTRTVIEGETALERVAEKVTSMQLTEVDLERIRQNPDVDIVYRNPAEGQHPNALFTGFIARDPSANRSVYEHVRFGDDPTFKSQYISTTRNIQVARDFQRSPTPFYVIDLNKVSNPIVDLTNPTILLTHIPDPKDYVNKWARRSQEVLVERMIPPSAIIGVVP